MTEPLDFSTAYPDILLLTTGPATEPVADLLKETLTVHGFEVSRLPIERADPDFLLDFNQLVLCCTTDGEQDHSAPAAEFFDEMARRASDLSHLAFGIVSVAERPYEPHAAADRFRALLDTLGAVEVVDPNRIEIGSGQADTARRWGLECAAAFAEAFEPVEE